MLEFCRSDRSIDSSSSRWGSMGIRLRTSGSSMSLNRCQCYLRYCCFVYGILRGILAAERVGRVRICSLKAVMGDVRR